MKLTTMQVLVGCIMPMCIHRAAAEPDFCLSTGASASHQIDSSLWALPEDLDWRVVLRTHLDDASPSVSMTLSLGENILFMVPEAVGRVLETESPPELLEFLSILSGEVEKFNPRAWRRDHALHNWTLIVSRRLHGTRNGLPPYVQMLGYVTSRDGE